METVGEVSNSQSSYDSSSLLNSAGVLGTEPTFPAREPEKRYKMGSLILPVIVVLAVAFLFRMYIAAPYLVEGASMENTFQTFDYLIVDRLSYRLGEPARGDVVVFHFPLDTSRTFIKRIVGLPGDTVTLSGESVTIRNAEHPDGFVLDEPYIADIHRTQSDMSVTVNDQEYFVMGDNRKESADSRYWGALPKSDLVGRAFMRLYPANGISLLPGEHRYRAETVTSGL